MIIDFSLSLANISVLSTYKLQRIVSTSYTIETDDIQTFKFEAALSENRSRDHVLVSVDLLKRKYLLNQ